MVAEVTVEGEMAVTMEAVAVGTQSQNCHSSFASLAFYSGGLFLPFCSALSSTTGCKPATDASRQQMQLPVTQRIQKGQPPRQCCSWVMTGHHSMPMSSRMPQQVMALQQDTQQTGQEKQALSAGLQECYP